MTPTIIRKPLPVERIRTATYGKFGQNKPLRDVPYVPTPQWVVSEMLKLAEVGPRDVLYDLGCGDGRICVTAARDFGARAVGIDIDPDRIAESKKNADLAKVWESTRFEQLSFFDVDFREATVVTLYLLPFANAKLRPKLLNDLKPGSRIVAHSFGIVGWSPDRTVDLPYEERRIYRWTVPATVGGRWNCTIRLPDGKTRHGELEIEQEYQTVIGVLRVLSHDYSLEKIAIHGKRLTFKLCGAEYFCEAGNDSIHGVGRTREHPKWGLELRARKIG